MSTPSNRVLRMVSWIGLGVSLATLIFSLPRTFDNGGGPGRVLGNTAGCWWTLLLIFVLITPTRTIGVRALIGAWLAGFFGVLSLARMTGRPIVDHFGGGTFAVVVWAPLTEELLKLAPVALFLLISVRNRVVRPSASDGMLFAATVGAAFSVAENALYARPVAGLGGHLPATFLVPSMQTTALGAPAAGHLVFTALTGLGLATTLAYRGHRLAWLAAPACFLIVFAEHAAANEQGLLAGAPGPAWLTALRILTLNGWLSTVVWAVSAALIVRAETRITRPSVEPSGGPLSAYRWPFRPSPALVLRRAHELVCAQLAPSSMGAQR